MDGVNKAQRIALRLLGSAGEEAERESRSWFLICPDCGHEISYWDAGGLRLGAASKGKRVRMRCERCQARSWHDLVRRPEQAEDADP
jgi:hypothetical protein